MLFNKNKIITCTFDMGIYKSLDVHLQPASLYIPEWWRKIPKDSGEHEAFPIPGKELIPNGRTVKYCPSFADVYNLGYVLPSPVDIWLSVSKDDNNIYYWKTPSNDYQLDVHSDNQLVNHINSNIKKVFKFVNPIQIIGPKGYSLMQLPMLHHYETIIDWYVPYGIIDIDTHHEINPQIYYVSDKDEILIKAGEPLCYYIPFKRDNIKIEMKAMEDKYKNKINVSKYLAHRNFSRGYLKKQRRY